MTKVSVLVAVYNAEKYLRQCLDSLVGQTLKDIQIICIDDASTDNSLNILKEYALNDSRIVILQQEKNQGQAKARNKGLSVVTGDYVTMVDSDDWITLDALEKLYEVVVNYPNTDAVLFDLNYYFEDSHNEKPFINKTAKTVLTGKEACLLSLYWDIHGIYLIRTSIHKTYPYDDSCLLYSDDNTTRFHFLHSREVRFSTGKYFYRQHDNSFTKADGIRRIDWLEATLSMKDSLTKEDMDRDVLRSYETFRWIGIVGVYGYYLNHKSIFTKEQQTQILGRIRRSVESVDISLLDYTKYKFGYIPFKRCYPLFILQENIYFYLRRLLKRKNV